MFIPKKFLIGGAGILILLMGVGIGMELKRTPSDSLGASSSLRSSSAPPLRAGASLRTPEALRDNKSGGGLANSRAEDGVKVTRVIDGDTIEIEGGQRVRYIGIDTPETVDPRKPVQCFGIEASKKNKELVEGQRVRLEKDITDRDKYRRLLRYVWAGDTFVNLELVKQGFAHSYSYPPDIKYQDRFVEAEREARMAKSGLWSVCRGEPDVIATPPAALTADGPIDSCVIKGNVSSSGEKIYHLPDCGSYAKTQIDTGRGERWFCSETEAQTAGWRRALNCP